MKTKITVASKELRLSYKLKATGVTSPNSENSLPHNQFSITISSGDIPGPRVIKKQFLFYDSYANYEREYLTLSEHDIKQAFRSFVSNADFGTYDFKDFCLELGYNEDSRAAERMHKECKKALGTLLDLGFSESEISDILNDLVSQGIE